MFGAMIRRASARGRGMQPQMGMQRRPAPRPGGPVGAGAQPSGGATAAMLSAAMGKMGPSPNALEAAPMAGAGGFQTLPQPRPVQTPQPEINPQGGVPGPFGGPAMPKPRPYMQGGGFTGRGGGGFF